MSKQLESEDWRDIANGRERATTPTSGNDLAEVLRRVNAFGSAIANREHATDKETAERIVDARFAAIEAYLTRLLKPTSGNDEVEAMCADLDALIAASTTDDGPSDLLVSAVALIRKQAAQIEWKVTVATEALRQRDEAYAQIAELQKATAQTSVSPTPADSAARPETE